MFETNLLLFCYVYPKFHWLRQIAFFGPDSIRNQKGAMANTK